MNISHIDIGLPKIFDEVVNCSFQPPIGSSSLGTLKTELDRPYAGEDSRKSVINLSNEQREKLVQSANELFGSCQLSGLSRYPVDGYMGWHTNSNQPGTRIYIVYSWGASSFLWFDGAKIVEDKESIGWNIRKFSFDETELFWHAVVGERVAIGFKLEE